MIVKKMKTNKLFVVLLCVASIIVSCISGTVAYQTVTNTKTNVIVIGSSSGIKARIDESPVDKEGHFIDGTRVLHNEYKIICGHTYDKDPKITVTSGGDCYLFLKIKNDVKDSLIEDSTNTIDSQVLNNGWSVFDAQKGIYVRTCPGVGNTYSIFESFSIAKDADMSSADVISIDIQGYAVESKDYPTVTDAWNAVLTEVPEAAG